MQDEVFPDDDDFGRIFRNNAVLSAQGIPQYRRDHGQLRCRRRLPAGALRHRADDRRLGPLPGRARPGESGHRPGHLPRGRWAAPTCTRPISGTVDYREPDDDSCLARLRRLVALLPPDPAPRVDASRDRRRRPGPSEDLYRVVRTDPSAQYDVRDLLACVLDGGRFDEYRAEYGRTLVCGFGRLGGNAAGRGRQPAAAVPARGGGPFQFGGVIYADSADKAARFVLECNQSRLPILFIQDVNGFDVGRDAERSGIIRRGAKLVNAVSNSTVPKITLIVGHSFGAGHYALCGKAFDPRFLFAWPGARYAVMGAQQAARTMLDVNVATLKRQGKAIDDAELDRHGRGAATAVRPRDRHPLRRRPALDRRDHRPGADPRGPDPGVRSRHALPRYPSITTGVFQV